MKFGIMFANVGPYTTGEGATTVAEVAESVGFESIWTVEHVVVPKDYQSAYPYSPTGKMPGGREDFPIPDPLVWLSWVAAKTTTVKLCTGVLILPQRNPLLLAKEVATLDSMSGGRVELGIGVGWLEEEFDALGVPFARRGARTDDHIRALKTLWSPDESGTATHDGEFVSFSDVYSRPLPANGTVPIVVGGHSDAAARRAGRLGDGFFPGKGDVDELTRLFGIVRDTAKAHDRDPDAIELTVGMPRDPADIERLAEAGVTRMIVPSGTPDQLAKLGERLVAAHG
ncbi:MAG: LLM class F420-dependent oxidoreductase [Actinomycetota bacterium]|nr:LLM class F420-dependent oxidoreductase [Actinomycetota bacterium]